MKVLVTGGAGFIGSHITKKMVDKGYNVIVLDNFHLGKEDNLEEVKDNIEIVSADVVDIFKTNIGKVDFIFNEGVYSSSLMYKQNPSLVSKTIEGAVALFEFAYKYDTPIAFASSSSIYNGLPTPHREDSIPKVTDYYTEARIAIERLAKLYNKLKKVKSVSLRYFSVYGPKEEHKGKFANVVSQFLWRMMRDESPIIFGDGTQTRDFIYVDDVVEANLLAMEKLLEEEISYEIINVGTGKSKNFNEVVSILNKTLKKDIKPVYVENPIENYVMHTLADTTKAEKLLGFKAKVEFEDGVKRLVEYYRGKHFDV